MWNITSSCDIAVQKGYHQTGAGSVEDDQDGEQLKDLGVFSVHKGREI